MTYNITYPQAILIDLDTILHGDITMIDLVNYLGQRYDLIFITEQSASLEIIDNLNNYISVQYNILWEMKDSSEYDIRKAALDQSYNIILTL